MNKSFRKFFAVAAACAVASAAAAAEADVTIFFVALNIYLTIRQVLN